VFVLIEEFIALIKLYAIYWKNTT